MFLAIALLTGIGAIIATDVGRWLFGIVTVLLLLGAVRYFRLAAHWREVEKEQPPKR